jgi:hypothetical protein
MDDLIPSRPCGPPVTLPEPGASKSRHAAPVTTALLHYVGGYETEAPSLRITFYSRSRFIFFSFFFFFPAVLVFAQEYPSRPVAFIVGRTPGRSFPSGTDIPRRSVLAKKLGEVWKGISR